MTAKEKVDALILAGNTATGESRTDLTTVVQDLVDGYGQGGGFEYSIPIKTGNVYLFDPTPVYITVEEVQ